MGCGCFPNPKIQEGEEWELATLSFLVALTLGALSSVE